MPAYFTPEDSQKALANAATLDEVANGNVGQIVTSPDGREFPTLAEAFDRIQVITNNAELTADQKYQQIQDLITEMSTDLQIAKAAGAGANGWTAGLIADASGMTQQKVNALVQQISMSADLVSHYAAMRKPVAIYAKKGSVANTLFLGFEYANTRFVQYGFTTDADGLTRLTSAKIGKMVYSDIATGEAGQVTLSGTYIPSGDNSYTATVGNSFSGSFTGTGFKFHTRRDSNGGLWRFVVDGGAPIDVSVYSATTVDTVDVTTALPVVSGLTQGTHTFVATFQGQDPAHPVGSPRGWLKYNATTGITTQWLKRSFDMSAPDNKISPTSAPVGIVSSPNYYANTIGQQMTFSFTGTGLTLNHYADNRGGLWRFVIDGGANIDISTYSSVAGSKQTTVVTGLSNTTHTGTMTFQGQDPANPVTTPRGWYEYDAAAPRTFTVTPRTAKQTEEMLAPASVLEWAISARPASQTAMALTWNPIHSGVANVSRNIVKSILLNGTAYSTIAALPLTTAYTAISSFSMSQTFTTYNGNDAAGTYPMLNAVVSHELNSRGSILHRQRFTAANDTYIANGYVSMLGANTIVDKIESSRFENYSVNSAVTATIPYLEAAAGMSAKFSADNYVFVTQSKVPDQAYQLAKNNDVLFYSNVRSDAIKTYMSGFKANTTIPAGSVVNHAVEYFAGEY